MPAVRMTPEEILRERDRKRKYYRNTCLFWIAAQIVFLAYIVYLTCNVKTAP